MVEIDIGFLKGSINGLIGLIRVNGSKSFNGSNVSGLPPRV